MSDLAIGIDVASVARVSAVLERCPRFTQRVFTDAEQRHCAGRPRRWASRWAGKEAVRKLAGGRRVRLPAFHDVEIATDRDGRPLATVRGWDAPVAISLSHDGDWAVAVAVVSVPPAPPDAGAGAPPATVRAVSAPGPTAASPPAPLLPVPASVRLPARPADAHKGTFGTVMVVGGAPGFSGAPQLAAMGAARAGAGLVRAGVPDSVHSLVASRCLEVMVHALPSAEAGGLAGSSVARLLELLDSADALVLGPGLTTAAEPARVVLELLDRLACAVVVDADALNVAARDGYDWHRCPQPVVITPHPAEMGRLAGLSVAGVQRDRVGLAGSYAAERNVTVVLKGSGTVVAAPDGRVHVAAPGVVALATGGTGDVLAGVIAAMLGQGLEPFHAAVAGVTVHAEAGAAVQAQRGRAGGLAGDLVEALPAAQERLRQALESGAPSRSQPP